MTLVQIRNALVAQMATWPHGGVPVFYENTEEVDLEAIGSSFVKCEVHFNGAKQANIDPDPFRRIYGTLVLTVFQRGTEGTVTTLGYLDDLTAMFKFKNLSGVKLQAPEPGGEVNKQGWFSMQLRTQFYADSNN